MTVVNASTVFSMYRYKEMVEEYANIISLENINLYNEILNKSEYVEGTNYGLIKQIKKSKEYNPYDLVYTNPYQKYLNTK
jgi:hypothetical protein